MKRRLAVMFKSARRRLTEARSWLARWRIIVAALMGTAVIIAVLIALLVFWASATWTKAAIDWLTYHPPGP